MLAENHVISKHYTKTAIQMSSYACICLLMYIKIKYHFPLECLIETAPLCASVDILVYIWNIFLYAALEKS